MIEAHACEADADSPGQDAEFGTEWVCPQCGMTFVAHKSPPGYTARIVWIGD